MPKTRKLTDEDLKMLADRDRKMDLGELPYVLYQDRTHYTANPEVLAELGLVSGQTVSDAVIAAILAANLASLQARFAVEAAIKADEATP